MNLEEPIRVLITGAAGHIGYILAFRIANGDLFGNKKIILHLLELTHALPALDSLVQELFDCTFPNLIDVIGTDSLEKAFFNIDVAFLIGSFPRKPGMKKEDYLKNNSLIFQKQGQALSDYSKKTVKVLVIGNPANTNALVLINSLNEIPFTNVTAMTRLDHNRAINVLSSKLKIHSNKIHKVIIWGNRSNTQHIDLSQTEIDDEFERKPLEDQNLNFTINEEISKRGQNSIAASAANAAIFHMKDWFFGSNLNDYISMGVLVPESQPYGIPKGLVFSLPCKVNNKGEIEIIENLNLNKETKEKILLNIEELKSEAIISFESF